MSKLRGATYLTIQEFRNRVKELIPTCSNLQEVARVVTGEFYRYFQEDVVLARFYVTVPYQDLPQFHQNFIDRLAKEKRIGGSINPGVRVLTLLGSSGEEESWNNPLNSQNHLGIPLVSAGFVEGIPMVARLLKELGYKMDWLGNKTEGIQTRTIEDLSGLFYVQDARKRVDRLGRKVISAEDFVEAHNIKTVFGVGSSYISSEVFMVLIIFTREEIDRQTVERFIVFPTELTSHTIGLVMKNKIFPPF